MIKGRVVEERGNGRLGDRTTRPDGTPGFSGVGFRDRTSLGVRIPPPTPVSVGVEVPQFFPDLPLPTVGSLLVQETTPSDLRKDLLLNDLGTDLVTHPYKLSSHVPLR